MTGSDPRGVSEQPQPAAPAQAGPSGPPQVPPTPRKSRHGCLIATIVAVIAVVALAAAAVVFVGMLTANTTKIRQAEKDYAAAVSSLDKAVTSFGKATTEPSGAAKKAALGQADTALRAARDEAAATRTSVDALPDSTGKKQYLDSLASMNGALDASQRLAAYLGVAGQMSTKMSQAASAGAKGNSDLGAAVTASNANDFTVMRKKAQSASANFVESAMLFREADQLDTSAGIDLLAAFADKRKQEAELLIRMASEGANHATKAFNADVEQARALRKQASAIPDPAIVKDSAWLAHRVKPMAAKVSDALTRADSLHTAALKSLGYGAAPAN